MRLRALITALLSAACTAATPRPDVIVLDAGLQTIRGGSGTPAISAAVTRSDRQVARGIAGVRRLGQNARATSGDSFHIGSVTKPFTATLAGLLVTEGRLS